MEPADQILRKLAIHDDVLFRTLSEEDGPLEVAPLDPKPRALVRVASLIAVDATAPCYLWAAEAARAAGATDEELVACLVAVLPVVGAARVVSAAPKLGLALGYDVGAALEDADPVVG